MRLHLEREELWDIAPRRGRCPGEIPVKFKWGVPDNLGLMINLDEAGYGPGFVI
jgi:hypothetical protein